MRDNSFVEKSFSKPTSIYETNVLHAFILRFHRVEVNENL